MRSKTYSMYQHDNGLVRCVWVQHETRKCAVAALTLAGVHDAYRLRKSPVQGPMRNGLIAFGKWQPAPKLDEALGL